LEEHLVHFGVGAAWIEIRYWELILIYRRVAAHMSILAAAAVLAAFRHTRRRRHRDLLRRVRVGLDHMKIDHFRRFAVVSPPRILPVLRASRPKIIVVFQIGLARALVRQELPR